MVEQKNVVDGLLKFHQLSMTKRDYEKRFGTNKSFLEASRLVKRVLNELATLSRMGLTTNRQEHEIDATIYQH